MLRECNHDIASLSIDDLVRAYLAAKRKVIDAGYAREVAWQSMPDFPVTPERFMREAVWVILSTGMSAVVVSRLYPRMLEGLGGLDPEWLVRHRARARAQALDIFGHARKIDSIFDIAERIREMGSEGLCARMLDPEPFLRELPYIGPVTWRHLAKNLGAPVAKSDRHLARFAQVTGRLSVDALCSEISAWLGDPVPVVDIVLWRWSVLHARSCNEGGLGIPALVRASDGSTDHSESRELTDIGSECGIELVIRSSQASREEYAGTDDGRPRYIPEVVWKRLQRVRRFVRLALSWRPSSRLF
jgi:hypothetical protein